MKAKQLALFPESSIHGYVHPVYRGCTPCIEQPVEVAEAQAEELPFEQDGDDQ